jgi:hypothetical protein
MAIASLHIRKKETYQIRFEKKGNDSPCYDFAGRNSNSYGKND